MRRWGLVFVCGWLLGCVDPEEVNLRGTVDVVVVDGTITNLNEPQYIRLNRSTADRLTGRFGTLPLTQAQVVVMVDSAQVIKAIETQPGTYQLPIGFTGQIGHAYQLRFTLTDGTTYQSTQQLLPDVPPISRVYAEFNPNSLAKYPLGGFYTAGHDIYIDTQDTPDRHNFYRWDWTLYERQYYCRSCRRGVYAVNNILPHGHKDGRYYVPVKTSMKIALYPNIMAITTSLRLLRAIGGMIISVVLNAGKSFITIR